ncbi:general substrate transporter [Aspergillus multicolor]|uniref:general substrate transporter n=1 Tax=Aspergillus multicolor TaxID=41759 RepID=UPI003CCD789B
MSRQHASRLVPSSDTLLFLCIVGTSFADSVLTGFDSSLMGSLNVMPTYNAYFTLTTATTALNTASSYIGGCTGSLFAGLVADTYGRRLAIWTSAAISIIGAIIQATAVHIPMFIIGRVIVGIGLAVAATATPTFVAEVARPEYRAFALGIYYSCWGVGTLLATGVCYDTNSWTNNWAWRLPSLLQIVPALFAAAVVCFVPESPRWLMSQGRTDEALEVLAIVNNGGNKENASVIAQFEEMATAVKPEAKQQLTFLQSWTTKPNRRRLLIVTSFSVIVMLSGDSIITFYFGDMLTQAGIWDSTTQLEVNIVLTSWNLVIAVVASWYVDCVPRKILCSVSLGLLAVFQFLLGGLTARYGESDNKSDVYGTIASIFLCTAAYRLGLTQLTVLYPTEILSYQLRASGMGLYTFTTKMAGLVNAMVFPFALDDIRWKTYMVVGAADVAMAFGALVFYVETRGLGLEEVDGLFEGRGNSVPEVAVQEEVMVTEKGA